MGPTCLAAAVVLLAQANPAPQRPLEREILGPAKGLQEIQDYLEPRVPALPQVATAAEWDVQAARLRKGVLEKAVLRGEARRWSESPLKVEEAGQFEGKGYRVRKLRYEAVPGLWIPALLYVPDPVTGRVPVHMAVNGHDGKGKAADYKQIRCINLAKRGMIVLNVEWLGMGQLRGPGYGHYGMNQLDLCGTSGLAPFYLSMKRGLDLLLALENADPARVAVHGLSGGGWQTIFITALDERVTLSNPVAGYSSFRTRIRHGKDLGDSEQTPCDLATVADYTHLTALRAPRPTLLTYNSKDNCCFESGYALPPLVEAARPIFRLYGKEENLRTHVSDDPGDHNFGQDNRQALYRMVADHFRLGGPDEVPCADEVKTALELAVDLPQDNATFNTLARGLARALPREPGLPADRAGARARLRELLRARTFRVVAGQVGSEKVGETQVAYWQLAMDKDFTVPAVELARADSTKTALLFSEAGRRKLAREADQLGAAGYRVVAIDPFYYGESKIAQRDFLYALLLASVGERPLGVQAAQIAAAARWAEREFKGGPVTVVASGPRASLVALAAAALEERAIGALELRRAYGSLKEILEQGLTVEKAPELFCFGLLEAFDVPQLVALAAPRPVRFPEPSERARAELAPLKAFYAALGSEFDPLR